MNYLVLQSSCSMLSTQKNLVNLSKVSILIFLLSSLSDSNKWLVTCSETGYRWGILSHILVMYIIGFSTLLFWKHDCNSISQGSSQSTYLSIHRCFIHFYFIYIFLLPLYFLVFSKLLYSFSTSYSILWVPWYVLTHSCHKQSG